MFFSGDTVAPSIRGIAPRRASSPPRIRGNDDLSDRGGSRHIAGARLRLSALSPQTRSQKRNEKLSLQFLFFEALSFSIRLLHVISSIRGGRVNWRKFFFFPFFLRSHSMRRSSPPFLFFVRASFVVGFTRFAFFLVDFLRQSSRRFFAFLLFYICIKEIYLIIARGKRSGGCTLFSGFADVRSFFKKAIGCVTRR